MIETERAFGTTTITCDTCERDQTFDVDFYAAIKEAKEDGWIIMKDKDGSWKHVCWRCV